MTAPHATAGSDDDIDLPRVPLTSRPRTMLALLLLATALVFLPALGGEFVWDDTQLIYTNPFIRDLSRLGEALTHDFWHNPQSLEGSSGLSRLYYRPVVTLAYALQFRFFGEHPAGYHLVNLALHLGCVVLAFGWLRRRVGTRGDEGDHRLAALAWVMGAALFAVHPSRPESVAWISGSTDLWLGLFALLGLRAWDEHPRLGGAVLAGLCFFFATLSKETAVVLPALLLVDIALVRPPETRLGVALGRWAVAAAGVGFALVARFMVVARLAPRGILDMWSQAPQRVLSSFGHYLFETFTPWWPSVMRPLQAFAQQRPVYAPWSITLGALGFAALGSLAFAAWRRPVLRGWLADTLWFVVALGPTLNVVPMGMQSLVSARFLYLPLLGLCALAARTLLAAPARWCNTLRGALGVMLVGCAVVSSLHAARFADAETLWTAELRRNPNNYVAYSELFNYALEHRQYARVGPLITRAHDAAMSHGLPDLARDFAMQYARTLPSITPDDDADTLRGVRDFFQQAIDSPESVARLRTRFVRLDVRFSARERPPRTDLRLGAHLGWAHFRLGDTAQAEALLREAARQPHAYRARRYLAGTLAAQHRWREALDTLDGLLRANPADHNGRGLRATFVRYAGALAQPADDVSRLSLAANLEVDLTRSARARALVAPLLRDHPTRLEPVATRIHADLADHRPEAAVAFVRAACARAPEACPAFTEALQRALQSAPPPDAPN